MKNTQVNHMHKHRAIHGLLAILLASLMPVTACTSTNPPAETDGRTSTEQTTETAEVQETEISTEAETDAETENSALITSDQYASFIHSEEDKCSRPNVYFMGMSTINGTGEIYINENGEYELFYVGCTSTSAMAPNIFGSSEGVGKVTFTIDIGK